MTIASNAVSSGPYYPNGSTAIFPFNFKAVAPDEIEVVGITDNVETVYSPGLYTVILSGNSGSVAFAAAPASGPTLYIRSSPSFLQDISFENEGAWLPEVMTEALDRSAAKDLYLRERSNRSLRLPFGTSLNDIAPLPGGFLSFDASGQPIIATGTGGDSALRTDVAAPTGSSLIGFLQSGTGAVSRTGQDKLRDFVSVKDFGAKGDGATDDTVALQKAVDAAATSGGHVALPPGQYRTTAKIVMKRGVSFYGSGCWANFDAAPVYGGTWIMYEGPTTDPAFEFFDIRWSGLRDLGIAGAGSHERMGLFIYSDNNPATKTLNFERLMFVNLDLCVKWGDGGALNAQEQCDEITFREIQVVTAGRIFAINAPNAADFSRIERVSGELILDAAFDLIGSGFMPIAECAVGLSAGATMFRVTSTGPDPLRITGCQSEGDPTAKFLTYNATNDQGAIHLDANVINQPVEVNGITRVTSQNNYINTTITTTGFVRWTSRNDVWDGVYGQPLHTPQINIGTGGIFRAEAQRNATGYVGFSLPVGFSFDDGTFAAGGYERTGVTRAGVIAPAFATSGAYVVGDYVQPVTPNDHAYVVTVAGTAAGSEPTWPTTSGATVTSGTVTFQEIGQSAITKGVGAIAA